MTTLPPARTVHLFPTCAVLLDAEGRLQLAGIYLAVSRRPKHLPTRWLSVGVSETLASAWDDQHFEGPEAVFVGRPDGQRCEHKGNPWIYAVPELAFAYADWIHPRIGGEVREQLAPQLRALGLLSALKPLPAH